MMQAEYGQQNLYISVQYSGVMERLTTLSLWLLKRNEVASLKPIHLCLPLTIAICSQAK